MRQRADPKGPYQGKPTERWLIITGLQALTAAGYCEECLPFLWHLN